MAKVGPKPWSRRAGELVYAQQLSGVHRPLKRDEREVLVETARWNSEDLDALRSLAPDSAKPFMDQVFVARAAHVGAIHAEAFALSVDSRVAVVSDRLVLSLAVFGSALKEFELDFYQYLLPRLRSQPKQVLPLPESIALLEKHGAAFGNLHRGGPLIRKVRNLIWDLDDSSVPLTSISSRWADIRTSGTRDLYFADAARRFVLAHEIAHHLLNHHRLGARSRSAPGADLLREHRDSSVEVELPVATQEQQDELDADSLAFILLLGLDLEADDSDRYERGLDAIAGAFCALPALDLAGRKNTSDLEIAGDLRRVETHPPFAVRALNLLTMAGYLTGEPPEGPTFHEELGREVSGHGVGLALVLWACGSMMKTISASRLLLPGELQRRGSLTNYPLLRGRPRLVVPPGFRSPRSG